MNRNQKIALGCGGAGCLGLIVVAIAGGLLYYFMGRSGAMRDYNYNVSTNRNYNTNDNSNITANSNVDENDNDNSSNSNSSSTSAASMSEEDKHKLYQAAGMTGDAELVRRVSVKIGIMDEDFSPGSKYQQFLTEHIEWAIRNVDFISSLNTPDKARAYVNENMN